MKKNSRKLSFYVHLCFHFIVFLLVFLHFGTLESKNEKKLEDIFILLSFVFSFHCLFAGFPAFRDPGEQK